MRKCIILLFLLFIFINPAFTNEIMNDVYDSRYGNAKSYKENKVAITNKISAIFNANGGEGYDRVGFSTVNKIVKAIQKAS